MVMLQGGHAQASGRRSATGDSGSMRTQFMLSYEVRSLDTTIYVFLHVKIMDLFIPSDEVLCCTNAALEFAWQMPRPVCDVHPTAGCRCTVT